jgi:phosphoribosylformimino-5-aminoimidazole carboxamide ribotide isomerase
LLSFPPCDNAFSTFRLFDFSMQLIPVIDLLGGVVVRGVAGRRDEYRPVTSALSPSADALDVARAFRETLGLDRLYVADLDAILHHRPNRDLYRQLASDGFRLVIDAGLREADDAEGVVEAGAEAVVAGLETLAGPDALREMCDRIGPRRVVFSLDLKDGKPLGNLGPWGNSRASGIGATHTADAGANKSQVILAPALDIAARAIACGVRRMIVLDLGQVGIGQGVGTLELCGAIRAQHRNVEIVTGGGVRDLDDLQAIAAAGVAGALVASAFHSGAIGRRELDLLRP